MSTKNIIDICHYVAPSFSNRLSSQRVENIIVSDIQHSSIQLRHKIFSLICCACIKNGADSFLIFSNFQLGYDVHKDDVAG